MNLKLKAAIVERFGSQLAASREVDIAEGRLSRIVREHTAPTPEERKRLEQALGRERVEQCFAASSGETAV